MKTTVSHTLTLILIDLLKLTRDSHDQVRLQLIEQELQLTKCPNSKERAPQTICRNQQNHRQWPKARELILFRVPASLKTISYQIQDLQT